MSGNWSKMMSKSLYHPCPARNRGNALPPLPRRPFAAAHIAVGAAQVLPGQAGAIVRREHDQRVATQPRPVDGAEDFPDGPVQRLEVVAEPPPHRAVREVGLGKRRGVGVVRAEVDEERVGRGFQAWYQGVSFDELNRCVDVLVVESKKRGRLLIGGAIGGES